MQSHSRSEQALSWDDVQLFLVLFRSRTMGQAAASLDVDPSTVSRRLAGLEEVLDTVLFDRGRDGLRPTKAAEDLLPLAEVAEHGITQFTAAVDGLEREVSGLVRVTCPPDVAEVIVLPVLRRLLERHRRLRVSLEPGEATLDLNRREADLALRVARPTRGDLVARRVLNVTWRAAASRELATRLGRLDELADAPWIGWGERLSGSPPARWLNGLAGIDPVLRSDSIATHVAATRAGLGIALLPSPTIAHHGLVPVELAEPARAALAPWPAHPLFLVTHRALIDVPRVRAVWDGLLEELADVEDG